MDERQMTSDNQSSTHTATRNSTARLLALAVKEIYQDIKIGRTSINDKGFSCDFLLPRSLNDEDLVQIEKRMRDLAAKKMPIEVTTLPKNEAVTLFNSSGQTFQSQLASRQATDTVTISTIGDLKDIVEGDCLASTAGLKNFKLMSVAGAYWDGDAKNANLQRIQVTAWNTRKDLEDHLQRLEEIKERDHRRLGEKLELFATMPFSPGNPILLPKGMVVFNAMSRFIGDTFAANGYQQVRGPVMCHQSLWEKSGHWEHYRDDMFLIEGKKGDQYGLKPMNCPVHMSIFGMRQRSYRELPYRLHDQSVLHRNEASGALSGMTRLRSFCQDDTHIFIRPDQVGDEISRILQMVDHVYSAFGMKYTTKLSTKPDNALGTQEEWDRAESALTKALEKSGKPFTTNPKDGAFYGPKIDFDVEDALGRNWQVATAQLDFQMPKRFGLTYVDENGQEQRPVVIHNAVFGAIERFMAIAIESYNGRFPLWLSPTQVRVLPVTEAAHSYAEAVTDKFNSLGLRTELDASSNRLGKKIALAEADRIPVIAVLGMNEVEKQSVTLRFTGTGNDNKRQEEMTVDSAAQYLLKLSERPPILRLPARTMG